jgi:hypothetical protein
MPKKESGPETAAPLTAAELIRKKHPKHDKRHGASVDGAGDPNVVDLDDEIRRLEAELQEMSSDDDDESESSASALADQEDKSDTKATMKAAVLALSSVKDDRIERLPAASLPAPVPASKKRKTDDAASTTAGKKKAQKRSDKTPNLSGGLEVSQGLKNAVQEVLRGYQPRSAEHLPFYCRCCAKQYDNLDEFRQHQSTDFHRAAVEMERKASYCKLCRKQLTSPVQLQEHLKSKPHRERLQSLQSRRGPPPPRQPRQQQQQQQQRPRR